MKGYNLVGDAFGVPYEFLSRNEIKNLKLDEMQGNDTNLGVESRWSSLIPAGSWSDDTSMLIAGMDSIIQNYGEINYDNVMKNYMEWLKSAKYTSYGVTFGIGGIIYDSMARYFNGVPALDCGGKGFMDNGNGSLMRILPFSIYCINNNLSDEETIEIISKASGLTHANDVSKMGYDTDTVAGITGSLAGVLYGSDSIPTKWLDKLKRKNYLVEMAEKFDLVVPYQNN